MENSIQDNKKNDSSLAGLKAPSGDVKTDLFEIRQEDTNCCRVDALFGDIKTVPSKQISAVNYSPSTADSADPNVTRFCTYVQWQYRRRMSALTEHKRKREI